MPSMGYSRAEHASAISGAGCGVLQCPRPGPHTRRSGLLQAAERHGDSKRLLTYWCSWQSDTVHLLWHVRGS